MIQIELLEDFESVYETSFELPPTAVIIVRQRAFKEIMQSIVPSSTWDIYLGMLHTGRVFEDFKAYVGCVPTANEVDYKYSML